MHGPSWSCVTHSMPASAVCEAIGWAAFQSMDNQILLYGVGADGYKLNRKKMLLSLTLVYAFYYVCRLGLSVMK